VRQRRVPAMEAMRIDSKSTMDSRFRGNDGHVVRQGPPRCHGCQAPRGVHHACPASRRPC
jgi:hypothetical protein